MKDGDLSEWCWQTEQILKHFFMVLLQDLQHSLWFLFIYISSKRLTVHYMIYISISMCVPWGLNQLLLMKTSINNLQEHIVFRKYSGENLILIQRKRLQNRSNFPLYLLFYFVVFDFFQTARKHISFQCQHYHLYSNKDSVFLCKT